MSMYGWFGLIAVCFSAAYAVWLINRNRKSYQALLEERDRLSACVTHWRYADGTHVPQHKRMKMFQNLHKVSHQIRKHPDNPQNARERLGADLLP